MTYHRTVLLHEGVAALNLKPDGVYVDVTFGGGGHSKLILEELKGGKLIAFDQDPDANQNAPADDRFQLLQANFRFVQNFLAVSAPEGADGILADLGVSGYQFDTGHRGFSFRFDADLDMRMNKSQELTAAKVLNEYAQDDLARMFRIYGETSFAGALARRVVATREEKPIQRTTELAKLVESVVPVPKVNSEMPKVFQALRIEVNDELGALEQFLIGAEASLKPGGRLVVISYHSLEDRRVKHFMRSGNFDDVLRKDLYGNPIRPLEPIGKAVKPSQNEIESNPRARSAVMRIAEKTSNG